MTVVIAGAGIAGLTLALSCRQVGVPFVIFERVAKLEALGVGINLQPHSVRELFDLGLAPQLDAVGIRTRELVYFSKLGRRIWAEPRGCQAGYAWPQYSLHRGRLLTMLHEALQRATRPAIVETGSTVRGFRPRGNGVEVMIEAADGGHRMVNGTVLIACDGIHSRLRAELNPGEGPPKWSGHLLWRGVTRAKPFMSGATIAYAGHATQKFVTYPISAADPESGEAIINWIAERKLDPSQEPRREDYNRGGRLEEFLPAFEDWSFDWLDIPRLIRTHELCFEYPMIDRDPLPRWTYGPVTLLGDAAHPMYPIGSNGASQSIIDARVLTRSFLEHGVGEAALQAYEETRRPATTRVVLANRGNGPDHVMEIVEQRCGGAFDDISAVLSHSELAEIAARYKAVAGMDVATLNASPPTLCVAPTGNLEGNAANGQ